MAAAAGHDPDPYSDSKPDIRRLDGAVSRSKGAALALAVREWATGGCPEQVRVRVRVIRHSDAESLGY